MISKDRVKTVILQKEVFQKNGETGEMETIRQEFVKTVQRENFIQAYVDGIKGILKLESKTDIRIVVALWERAEWNTNKIILIKSEKEAIAEELGYKSSQVIDNSIRRLVSRNILVKGGRSLYYLNPNYFFRGTSKERVSAIEFVYRLNIE